MNNESKEFILLAGYRRYAAVKKLGWNKVSAKIYGEDSVIDIKLTDIDLGDNSRKDETSFALTELMESIKQNGLIQPVVVARAKNLTENDFIALNLVENIHRKDLSPFEIGMRIKRLRDVGLNNGEIAVRLGLAKHNVEHLLDIGKAFTEKDLEKVDFMGKGNISKTGKISYTTARIIAGTRITKEQKRALLKEASSEEISAEKMDIIVRLISRGMSVNDAVTTYKDYARIHPQTIVKTKEIDELAKKNNLKSRASVIIAMLNGDIPLKPSIFYYIRNVSKDIDDD